ncbi:MAG: chromosome condensation regulator RCC1 [Flavobacterium sp. BFFFF2]|nr:MAG: chromosome condensation regulator RCC1 [Flavobacterium sp. BFFFF2]
MKKLFTLLVIALGISAHAQCWQSLSCSGEFHVAAIKTDGTLWQWGGNFMGSVVNTPTQVGLANNWSQVASSTNFVLALKTDGTLWAWGDNQHGALGNGTTTNELNPIQVGSASNWSAVYVGGEQVVAKKTDGTLWNWGVTAAHVVIGSGLTIDSFATTPAQIGAGFNWSTTKIDTGGLHTLAVKPDGTLWAWGNNQFNQFGNGTAVSSTAPVQIGTDTDWRIANGGEGSSFAIKTNGKLYAWGIAGQGRLGLGTITGTVAVPTQVGTDTDWKSVDGGNLQTLGLKNSGALYAWGTNTFGQLGDGTNTDKLVPTHIGTATDWAKIISGEETNYVIKTDGTLYVSGSGADGELGTGNNQSVNVFTALACPTSTTQCWVTGSANNTHVAGIKADGTLWAWGGNFMGTQLNAPTQIGTDHDWASVATGDYFVVALKTNGTLWAWGDNQYGELGNGTANNEFNPVQVGTGTNWASISTGLKHVVARKTDGTLWTWGATVVHFAVGGNEAVDSFLTTPTQVGTSNGWGTAYIAAGAFHTLIVKGDGTLWGWGNNLVNQLGNGNTTSTTTPAQIGIDTDWRMVGPGWGSSFAIKTNGKLYAWGIGDIRLGLGNLTSNVTVPTQVGTDTDWKLVKGGNTLTTAIKTSGALYNWGNNHLGELGDGTTTDRVTPTHIGTATDWINAVAGDQQIYVLKPDGTVYVVGTNQNGELGTGSTTSVTVLTPLNCPTSALETADFAVKSGVIIYPNPANTILNIQLSNDTAISKITITDLTGKVILTQTTNTSQVDVAPLAAGLYVVEAIAGSEKFTSKFVKE